MVFKKKEDPKVSSKTARRKETPSIISADLHIVGDINGDGELHVDGRVDGNIRCENLTIGKTGQIQGKIVATTLRLLGKITGTVRARTVSMAKTAHMIGDVAHEQIDVEAGALVDGLYKHLAPEDFEQRAQRFKEVSPPERLKTAITRTLNTDDTATKVTSKKGQQTKAYHA